jgi:NLI interacting factor-like phosphatase
VLDIAQGPRVSLTLHRYPCIKDLSRLGRDLARTVLVDDTPLAFCRQPDNGIPVFNFRCGLGPAGARLHDGHTALSCPT